MSVTVTYIRINFLQSLMLLYKLPKNLVTQFVPLNCLMLYIATNILLIYFTATWLDSFFVVIVSSHINFSKIDQIQEKVKKNCHTNCFAEIHKKLFFPQSIFSCWPASYCLRVNILDCLLTKPVFRSQSISVVYQMCTPCAMIAQTLQTLSWAWWVIHQ